MNIIISTPLDKYGIYGEDDVNFKLGEEQTYVPREKYNHEDPNIPYPAIKNVSAFDNFFFLLNSGKIWEAEISDLYSETDSYYFAQKRKALKGGYVTSEDAEVLFYNWFMKKSLKYWDAPKCVEDYLRDEGSAATQQKITHYLMKTQVSCDGSLEGICRANIYVYLVNRTDEKGGIGFANMQLSVVELANDPEFTKEMVDQKYRELVLDFMD